MERLKAKERIKERIDRKKEKEKNILDTEA